MKRKKYIFDRDYLKRCKESSVETKLNWLAAALEFGKAKKIPLKLGPVHTYAPFKEICVHRP